MQADKIYCMSSFLMYRYIADRNKTFKEGITARYFSPELNRVLVKNSVDLETSLRMQVEEATADGKAALALSGGIDSAILAKFMPKGSTAYTFKCVVPGVSVTDETVVAARYAEECGLKHEIIEIYWEDMVKYAPVLMKHKGAPIHSIEVQIYKAALEAQKNGFKRMIFGESADCLFGGLSNLLSREWTIDEFVERYSFVNPEKVLRNPSKDISPILRHEKNGYIDVHNFLSNEFFVESVGSYVNATSCAEFGLVIPYSKCKMSVPLDYERVRRGENKYLVREIFERLYPGFKVAPKTPMPRPTNEWFANWEGPVREEFLANCVNDLTGDQKWLLWSLEKFLDLFEV